MTYLPDIREQLLLLRNTAALDASVLDDEMLGSILDGVQSFASGDWGQKEEVGEKEGVSVGLDGVTMPAGFPEVYQSFVASGWGAVHAAEEFEGQGLPYSLATSVFETLGTANFSLTSCLTLTMGAIDALIVYGTDSQKSRFLPKMISGAWTGTMNLTEPQAGSDVGALRTKATPREDGTWNIKGSKIFISFGDHDLTENIIHLVLARTPGSPAGSRGISLFLVPKFRADENGAFVVKNDVRAVSCEEKVGMHAAPTCVMAFGEQDDCIGEMIGEENAGLQAMFAMMNSARIGVGLQGVQLCEAATQKAVAYAKDRVQGQRNGQPVSIIEFPDVRRMLLRMKATTQAARALIYYAAGCLDRAAEGSAADDARLQLITPLAKTYCSEAGVEVASLGIQVHGGLGYIEETGAARYWRDARIAPIYEGTSGIQAQDLVERKLRADGGKAFDALMSEILASVKHDQLKQLAQDCTKVAQHLLQSEKDDRLAGSYPFLVMFSVAVAGWLLEKQLQSLGDDAFGKAKAVTIRYFLDHMVPEASGLSQAAKAGAGLFYELDAEAF
ncbi:acyl-CoA dehydrogenase [Ruegeria sp.]|uniref:acyl-CoA dehydrogenase n=1 Tax=Ruegeria sp. TaxID=1879320 RepID=UPI003B5CC497